MTDREWKENMALIENLRYRLINSAGIPATERTLLRHGLCESLRYVAYKLEQESESVNP